MDVKDSKRFYETIAEHYEDIFPLKSQVVCFTKEHLTQNTKILDVGCATGAFSIAISEFSKDIRAFDLSSTMIEIAKNKEHHNVHFGLGNMLEIQKDYADFRFNIITCFGNTLVHLLSKEKIQFFLEQSYQLLEKGGVLLLQILNYDYILDNKITSLPKIENNILRFDRNYQMEKNSRIIEFKTSLFVKNKKKTVQNSSALYAIRPMELRILLDKAGFSKIKMYSSFTKNSLSKEKLPLVVEAFRR